MSQQKPNPFGKIFDTVSSPAPVPTPDPPRETEVPPPRKRGRPRGKKSDPEYDAAIAYIRKQTHIQVKRHLLDIEEQGQKLEFSELVQELLDLWVRAQKGEDPDILLSRFLDIQKN